MGEGFWWPNATVYMHHCMSPLSRYISPLPPTHRPYHVNSEIPVNWKFNSTSFNYTAQCCALHGYCIRPLLTPARTTPMSPIRLITWSYFGVFTQDKAVELSANLACCMSSASKRISSISIRALSLASSDSLARIFCYITPSSRQPLVHTSMVSTTLSTFHLLRSINE